MNAVPNRSSRPGDVAGRASGSGASLASRAAGAARVARRRRPGRVSPWLAAALALIVFPAVAPPPAAQGYEVVEITDGGSITGRVRFAIDERPDVDRIPVTKDNDVCGLRKQSEEFVIGEDGGLANAVIRVLGVTEGRAPSAEPPRLEQQACHYQPHVLAMMAGQKLEVSNSDPILHNVHSYLDERTVFNIAQPIQGQVTKVKVKEPGVLNVECDAGHTWMKAFIVVHDSPYFAVTDPSGTFRIDGLEPGTYEVEIWHEVLGAVSRTVTVEAGAETELQFDIGA